MTLPELLLEAARQLPAAEKLRLIRVLAEELDVEDDIAPLMPHKLYYLPTPYEAVGAGGTLMTAMKLQENSRD